MIDGPLLGLATTEELFREIITRFTITQTGPIMTQNALILAEMLGGLHALDREYRTAEPQEQEPDPSEHIHIWADIPPLTSHLCSCGATRRNEL